MRVTCLLSLMFKLLKPSYTMFGFVAVLSVYFVLLTAIKKNRGEDFSNQSFNKTLC